MNRQAITTIALIFGGVILATGILITGCTTAQEGDKSLFVTGTYGAINRGVYDGDATIADLKRHCDFALGTFNAIDGELLALDGKYYQIGSEGKVNPASDAMNTPNTTATFFKADKVIAIDKAMNYQELQQYLNGQLPTQNIFYAIKVNGTFDSIKARSLTKLNQPYPSTPYSTITQNEPTFDFNNIDGTMVIIVSPTYMSEISYPGYHAHFISSDGKSGGHMLDGRIAKGQAEVDFLPNFTVNLPQNSKFYQADFAKPK
jgi:acetolactate decarboxylase